MKKFYSLFLVLLMMITAQSQKRSWNGGNGSWKDITNWTPAGTPLASDILEFNAVSGTISNVPTMSLAGLIVTNGANITLTKPAAGGNNTLTITNGAAANDFVVSAGSVLIQGNEINITLSAGAGG